MSTSQPPSCSAPRHTSSSLFVTAKSTVRKHSFVPPTVANHTGALNPQVQQQSSLQHSSLTPAQAGYSAQDTMQVRLPETLHANTNLPMLPNEVLVEIARSCVDSWTLVIKRRLGASVSDLGLPTTINVQLASKLFYHDIRQELIKQYDGHITIDQSTIDLANDIFNASTGKIPWLAEHVTKLTLQSHYYFNGDGIGMDPQTLPNLKKLIFDLKRPNHLDFGGMTLEQVLSDQEEHPVAVGIVCVEGHNLLIGYNRWLVRVLLRRGVKVYIRIRMTGDGWSYPVLATWKLGNADGGFFLGFRGLSLDDGNAS